MKKVIKLTESELINIIKKVISEQTTPAQTTKQPSERIQNIANVMKSLVKKQVDVIQSNNPQLNGMTWNDYLKKFKVNPFDVANAKSLLKKQTPQQPKPQTAQKPQTVISSGSTAQKPQTVISSGSTS